jgi:hypothetical protein
VAGRSKEEEKRRGKRRGKDVLLANRKAVNCILETGLTPVRSAFRATNRAEVSAAIILYVDVNVDVDEEQTGNQDNEDDERAT